MRTSTRLAAVLVAGAVLAVGGQAHATITEALSLAELVAQADEVLVVSCEDAVPRRDPVGRIVTDHTLRVEEVVRGEASVGQPVVMRALGGAIGDLGMRVEGEPHLAIGGRYLVFLRRLADGVTLRPVGMSQGVMAIEEGPSGALQVLPGGAGLALRQRVAGGRLVAAPPALLHPEPLDALRERIGAVAP